MWSSQAAVGIREYCKASCRGLAGTSLLHLKETPLTESEQKMVKDKMADKESFDLTKVFKSYSFKEAEEKLLEGKSSDGVLILH